jgi:hypothetical protein
MTAEQMIQALIDELGMSKDEAIAFLIDAGELDEDGGLLSPEV